MLEGLTLVMLAAFVVHHTCFTGASRPLLDRPTQQLSRQLRHPVKNVVWVPPDAPAFNQGSVATSATNLVIVAGHSVLIGGNLEEAGTDENQWYLLEYQKGHGLPQAIIGHIQAGIDAAQRDPKSLLVFTGGHTRPATGPISECGSYFQVADALKMWPAGSTVRARTVAEEFSTDSFENL